MFIILVQGDWMTSVWEQTVHEMSNVSTVCAQEGIYTGMYISDDSVL